MKKMTDKSPIIINNELLFEQYDYFNTTKTYNKITGEMKKFNDDLYHAFVNKIPVILYIEDNNYICMSSEVGELDEKSHSMYARFNKVSGDHVYIIGVYIQKNGTVDIQNETEIILTADNIKTLFGNQSIAGAGNIDLYRHDVLYNAQTSDGTALKGSNLFEIISSNNLRIDSLQDLTTVLKPASSAAYPLGGVDNILQYKGGLWQAIINGKSYNITRLTDTVTTI